MTKRYILPILMLFATLAAKGQAYSFQFRIEGGTDSVLYIGQHYRDEIQLMDTARSSRKGFLFAGRKEWPRGIYALVRQDGKTVLTDFLVDDSRKFSLRADAEASPASIRVDGSSANSEMYAYMARIRDARHLQDSLQKLNDTAALRQLNDEMVRYEADYRQKYAGNLFFQLMDLCENPDVPEGVANGAAWIRAHYWDKFFAQLPSSQVSRQALLHSPQLFNKMNFFFFGRLLYYADSDTICRALDNLMDRIGDDDELCSYVLQYIEPRYYRSTRNVGWDAVWCHLAERYYLGQPPAWARESELYVMRNNYNRIRQSIIGAHGQELWMMDTTQIDQPEHWHSSHRQKARYVILWFWDPDCHHCQEHSAALKLLYDSLQQAPNKRLEVYAVGYTNDMEKWRRYVREHDFRWVNVGGSNTNIDYQEAYNVHSAPTMIILNERRDIIMNKMLPIDRLLPFLDEYERKQH